MSEELNYRGFYGSADFVEDENIYYGKLLHIDDLVMYDSPTKEGIVKAFKDAVDQYMKPAKGSDE